jgi:signal transduction histidine kinase
MSYQQATESPRSCRSKVLVVEDESIVALDIKDQVTGLGHEVVGTASSGAEAIEKTGTLVPDLVLMDIRLEGEMDGVTAAEQIHRRRDVPVIFLTAFGDDDTMRRVQADDPAGYLLKPFDERELCVAIRAALRQSRSNPPSGSQESQLCEEAQRALHVRDDILAFVSHDLRTPLTCIASSAELLLCSPEIVGARELVRRRVRTIQSGVEHMTRLLDDLSDVASIDAGHLRLQPRERRAAADLLTEALQIFEPLAATQSRGLVAELPPPDVEVMCDGARVLQVLSNLLGNALKFTAVGGEVKLRAEATGDEVCFSVVDTGPGLSPAQLPHVFERHWQASADQRRGSGLGLFIARGVVEAHGGRIGVRSEQGQGSTFFFTLPRADAAKAS